MGAKHSALLSRIRNNQLEELAPSEDQLSPETMKSVSDAIAASTRLRTLRLTHITDWRSHQFVSLCEVLKRCVHLRCLSIQDYAEMTEEDAAIALSTVLRHLPLESFVLRDCPLTYRGLAIVSNIFEALPEFGSSFQLSHLALSGCGIDQFSASEVASIVSSPYNSLKSLDLCRNDLGDEGFFVLFDSLSKCSSLMFLDVSECNLRQQAACLLASLLLLPTCSLQVVRANDNHINLIGANEISVALYKNSSLRVLELERNCLENVGGLLLLKSLRVNDTLERIELAGNLLHLDTRDNFDLLMKGETRVATRTIERDSSLSL